MFLNSQVYFSVVLGESPMIPEAHSVAIISHICMVHSTVADYSKLFLQKLRRYNYVTPKNYLDFINTYASLLEEKDKYILGKNGKTQIVYVSLYNMAQTYDTVLKI